TPTDVLTVNSANASASLIGAPAVVRHRRKVGVVSVGSATSPGIGVCGPVGHSSHEYERLLEADRQRVALRGKRLSFNFVKPLIQIDNRRERTATIRADDAELTPVDPIDAGGNVELDLAPCDRALTA